MSEMVCNDNCPYFELPNVFTPNGDGCNDFFGPFVSEQNSSSCAQVMENHCPRFVKHLTLEVFNRWGRSVYTYDSSQPNGVNIFWDGKDKNGDELGTGTYYYFTTVSFDVVDPALRKREYKGWVRIQR
jgi:gliding motility-associated-like protein